MKNDFQNEKAVLSKAVFWFWKSFFLSAAVILAFSISIGFAGCSSVKNKDWKDDEIVHPKYEELAENICEIVEQKHFSGAILVAQGKNVLFAKGFGPQDKKNADGGNNTIHSVFEAGSITKQMTAACIMQLVQAGKLSVDDKLSKFYPDYEAGNEISVKMLLNMRSGLTDHINAGDEFFPRKINRQIEKNQLNCVPVEKDLVLKHFYDAPLLAKPDSTYFYCNTNYYLLAKIIEQVSGLSYEDYLVQKVFTPCGMNASNVKFQQTTAKGYDYRHRYYSIPAEIGFGCGDLNSSVLDLYKWNTMFAAGKVVKKSTVKQMIDTESYGFGVYRKDNMIFHAGVTNVFNSYNSYHFDKKLSIIVLSNQPVSECNASVVANKIYKAMFVENVAFEM